MSDVETVSSVAPDVMPVEEPSVPAPLGELFGEEIMEDCRLMTLALMRVRSICSSEPTSAIVGEVRLYIQQITADMNQVADAGGYFNISGPRLGDEERLALGMGHMSFLDKLNCDVLQMTLGHAMQEYGFGRVDLDLLRRYWKHPGTVPVGGHLTLDEKLKMIKMRLEVPLGCFEQSMFPVLIGGLRRMMFCLRVGSTLAGNPAFMELAPSSDVALLLQQAEFRILVMHLCAWCGREARPKKHISLMRCGKCKKVNYCDRVCQRKDWYRDHGPVRVDGTSREAYIPSTGWCAHMGSKRLGVLMPELDYEAYMSHYG